MDERPPQQRSFIFLTWPLLIYKSCFALYVVYYIQQDYVWFCIAYLAIAVATITALYSVYRSIISWDTIVSVGGKKEKLFALLVNGFSLGIYSSCLAFEADQLHTFMSESSKLMLIILGLPAVFTFIVFLVADLRQE